MKKFRTAVSVIIMIIAGIIGLFKGGAAGVQSAEQFCFR